MNLLVIARHSRVITVSTANRAGNNEYFYVHTKTEIKAVALLKSEIKTCCNTYP